MLALRDQILPPTINLENQDPGTGEMDFVPNHARKVSVELPIWVTQRDQFILAVNPRNRRLKSVDVYFGPRRQAARSQTGCPPDRTGDLKFYSASMARRNRCSRKTPTII